MSRTPVMFSVQNPPFHHGLLTGVLVVVRGFFMRGEHPNAR
jgi:hypothetical protein